jgi:hypothetical protein
LQRPFFGAMKLPGKARDIGQRAEALRAFLADRHALYGFTDIVFEAQHVGADLQMDTVRMLVGLGAMTEWFAFRVSTSQRPVRCFCVHISEWRKHFIGRGGGFKRTPDRKAYLPGHDPKELAIRKCAEFGWHTDVADAAEACGILDFYLHLLAKADPRVAIPWRDRNLFGGRLDGMAQR